MKLSAHIPTESSYRANIPGVISAEHRPFWSVVIPTYNCAAYLNESLGSVLQQGIALEKLEIIVVDDCSTRDDPGAVVQRLAGDRVRFIRHERNVGKSANYTTGINATRGQWIHILHGDDRIQPEFYNSMESIIADWPTVGAVFCESRYINSTGEVTGRTGKEQQQSGLLNDWLEKIVIEQRIQTPSIVVRRDVYESLGGFDRRLCLTEDWEMWIRIASCFPFAFNTAAIADYRSFPENSSSEAHASGALAVDIRRNLQIVDEYLPTATIAKCKKARRVAIAHCLIRTIPSVLRQGGIRSWFRLCSEILTYSIRPRVLYYILRFSTRRSVR